MFLTLGKHPRGGREPDAHALAGHVYFSPLLQDPADRLPPHECLEQRDSLFPRRVPLRLTPASSSSRNRSSFTDADAPSRAILPVRGPLFFVFTFFRLDVITLLSGSFRHDDVFPVEHLTGCPGSSAVSREDTKPLPVEPHRKNL